MCEELFISKITMAKLKKEKKVVEKAKPKHFSIEVSVNGQTQVSKGHSFEEALSGIVAPASIKTDFKIVATHGKNVKERRLGVFAARRIFGNNTAMKLLASNITKQFNG